MRRTADDFCLPTSNSRTKQMAWQAGSLITLRINSIWLTAAAYDMTSSSPVPILHSARSRQRWKAAGSCHRHCVSRSWRKLRRLHVPTRDSVPDAADHYIPLIIRTPGQQDRQTVASSADQTSLAPTILELAGQPKPDWMRGSSLMSSLNHDGQGDGQGFAFTQYFDRHSITALVGLIDGQYHYVYYLDTQKTQLRPLNEAQIWSVDRPTARAIHSTVPGRHHAELCDRAIPPLQQLAYQGAPPGPLRLIFKSLLRRAGLRANLTRQGFALISVQGQQ